MKTIRAVRAACLVFCVFSAILLITLVAIVVGRADVVAAAMDPTGAADA